MRETQRSQSGQGWLALCLIIGIFIVLPLGLLTFDLTRYHWATLQMRSSVDSAALTGVATLASGDQSDPNNAYKRAVQDAWRAFRSNTIFDISLNSAPDPWSSHVNVAVPTTLAGSGLSVGEADIYFDLLDQNRTMIPNLSVPDGKVLRVHGMFGYRPVFGHYLHFPDILLIATSDGAVPQLELGICFDISGSMDDTTNVVCVNRHWRGVHPGSTHGGTLESQMPLEYAIAAQGKIYDIIGPTGSTATAGTRLNALYPQSLSRGNTSSCSTPIHFSELHWGPTYNWGPTTMTRGLRAPDGSGADAGSPPGNYDPANPTQDMGNGVWSGKWPTPANNRLFTDMIVRIDGRIGSAAWAGPSGYSYGGDSYNFSSIKYTVEAARGNLANDAVFNGAIPLLSSPWTAAQAGLLRSFYPTRKAGYQAAYIDAVENGVYTQDDTATGNNEIGTKLYSPIGWSRDAAKRFVTLMNNNTDAHFCFVAFSTDAGENWPGTKVHETDPYYKIDGYQPYINGGTETYTIPKVDLNKTSDKATETQQAIASLRPLGSTNIADALHLAYADLTDTGKYRTGSKKAIILFTDGVPNVSGTLHSANAITEADTPHNSEKIPIYTIGLSTNAAIVSEQFTWLNDNAGGIADVSDAKFFPVTNAQALDEAFRIIARQLVQLTVSR